MQSKITPDLLTAIFHRIPYRVMGALLKSNDIPSGKGMDKRLNMVMSCLDDDSKQAGLDNLLSHYLEHLCYGNKVVFHHVDTSGEQYLDLLSNLTVSENPYSSSWPLPLDHDQLGMLDDTPVLSYVQKTKKSTELIFCSVRTVYEHDSFNPDALGPNRPKFTNEYNEIVGIRPIYRQCYDVVTIKPDSVQFRIDYEKSYSRYLGKREIERYKLKLNKALFELLGKEAESLELPLDFSSAIKVLELDEDGILGKVQHTDNQGCDSNLSRRKLVDDVRDATFFSAGKAGVEGEGDKLKTHGFLMRYPTTLGDHDLYPELIIETDPGIYQKKVGTVYYAIIKSNLGKEDFDLIFTKLYKALS